MSRMKELAYVESGEADFDMEQARHLNTVLKAIFEPPTMVLCEACGETVVDAKTRYCLECWTGES